MSDPANISFQELIDALLNVDVPFHPRYLYRLSDLESEELARLEQVWSSVPAWRRQALMEDLEELGEQDTMLSFESVARIAVHDREAKVRLPAVRALWEFEEEKYIPLFSSLLENDADPEVRAVAATGLGRYIYLGELEEISEDILKQVEDLLLRTTSGNEETLVRRKALEALGFSSRDEVPPLIEQAYQSGNRDWLASALFAMGRSANNRWAPQVMAMLDHNLPAVRAEAIRAAGELELSEAVDTLLDLLDDPDDNARSAAIWSLSQLGGEGVREALEALYEETEDEEEAEFIEEALDNLAFTEDMQLMPLFDLPEDAETGEAGELGDLDDLDDMLDELDDEDSQD